MNRQRESGALLLEVAIALTIFAIGALAYVATFRPMTQAGADARTADQVQLALRNGAADIRQADFSTLYANFNNLQFDVPGLKASDGAAANVQVICFVDETSLPTEFGPILDLDEDGALSTTDCSTTYALLPVKLSLTYVSGFGTNTREMFLVVSEDS